MTGKIENSYITFINVVSAFAVLFLHANGCFWQFNSDPTSYWPSANVIECLCYFAVPMFFMISAIKLLDFFDRYSLREYLVKRIQKILIPFLAWNFIAVACKLLIGALELDSISLRFLYQGITGSTIIDIFWFFSSLFILYLSLPLFAAVEKVKRKTVFTYLTITGFVLNILIPFIKNVFNLDLNAPYSVMAVAGVLIWIPLGWLLHSCALSHLQKTIVYIFGIMGLLMHIVGTYQLSMKAGEIVGTFKGYQNVPCILYSAAMFVLLKDIGSILMKGKYAAFIKWLGGYTFAIYLIQFLLLAFVSLKTNIDQTTMAYRLGAPFVFAPIIIIITWCIRRIPVLRAIVP